MFVPLWGSIGNCEMNHDFSYEHILRKEGFLPLNVDMDLLEEVELQTG